MILPLESANILHFFEKNHEIIAQNEDENETLAYHDCTSEKCDVDITANIRKTIRHIDNYFLLIKMGNMKGG